MNTIKQFSEEIWQYIGNGQIEKAFVRLQNLLKGSPSFADIIHQAGRHNDLLRDIRDGVVKVEDATLERNKIRRALVDILHELEDSTEKLPKIKKEVENHLNSKARSTINKASISGNNNINIQGVADSNIHVQTGNKTEQKADKIYNIGKIDKADFS